MLLEIGLDDEASYAFSGKIIAPDLKHKPKTITMKKGDSFHCSQEPFIE